MAQSGDVSRLVLLLAFAFGLGAAGTAEAQVWKVKKGSKPAAAKPAKKSARAAKPTLKKKAATKPKKRQVELVPKDEDDLAIDADERERDRDRDRDRDPIEDDEPVIIRVEEVFD